MKKPDRRLQVGAVLTVLTTMMFFLVFSLDTTRTWWRGAERVQVTFSDVQGIRSDDPVHFHGIPCGRVTAVSFGQAGPGSAVAHAASAGGEAPDGLRVTLDLELPADVYAQLRQGSRASIDKTLTGVTVVQLFQGEGAPLDPNTVLVGEQPATINEITATMAETLDGVNAILESVHEIVARAEQDELITGTLTALREGVDSVDALARDLRETVAENRAPVRELTTHAAHLAAHLDAGTRNFSDTMASVEDTVARVGALAGHVDGWFVERRADLTVTTEEIASAATNLNTLSTELRRRPWRLLHSPTKEEALELDLYESVSQYSRGAVALRRGVDRMALLLAAADGDPELERQLGELLADLKARVQHQRSLEQGFLRRLEYINED